VQLLPRLEGSHSCFRCRAVLSDHRVLLREFGLGSKRWCHLS
jgi:hypothetical protein